MFGPALGSVLFWASLTLVKTLADALIPESILGPTELDPFSLVLVGVTLMLLVIFRPQGVLGNKKELAFNG